MNALQKELKQNNFTHLHKCGGSVYFFRYCGEVFRKCTNCHAYEIIQID